MISFNNSAGRGLVIVGVLSYLVWAAFLLSKAEDGQREGVLVILTAIAVVVATAQALAANKQATNLTRQMDQTMRPFIGFSLPHNADNSVDKMIPRFVLPIRNHGSLPGAISKMSVIINNKNVQISENNGLSLSGFRSGVLMPEQEEELKVELADAEWEQLAEGFAERVEAEIKVAVQYFIPSSERNFSTSSQFLSPTGTQRWTLVSGDVS